MSPANLTSRLLRAVFLLALVAFASGVARSARAEVPVVLELIGAPGEMASLDYLVSRPLVSDFAGGDPVVSPIETGFQLDFTPTLLGAGRVEVALELSIAFLAGPIEKRSLSTPQGRRRIQWAELQSYQVSANFQADDGEPVPLPPTPAGPPILATPRIVVPEGGGPAMVHIEVRVPFGGHEVELDPLRLLKEPRVAGVPARQNAVRHLTRRTFVSDVVSGDAVPARVEAGSELEVIADVANGTLGLDLGLRCRALDEEVPTFQVPTPHGKQKLQLPVLRTLAVETRVDVASGETLAIAGVRAVETEALVFATPHLLEEDGLQNVLVQARVVIAAGEPKEPKAEPLRSESLKNFALTGWEGQPIALAQVTQRDFVTGYQDGEPVTSPLETQARLEFTPSLLGADDVDLQIALDYGRLDPVVARFPVKTSGGGGALDLPAVHLLQLDTAVAVGSGQTLAVGGIISDEVRPGSRTRDEALLLATPQVGVADDPDAVELTALVAHVMEGDGPESRSVERLESGPVAAP
jgi:hypothetical protein